MWCGLWSEGSKVGVGGLAGKVCGGRDGRWV